MQAYQTQNLSLAVTLATCGVPFFSENGKLCPVVNIYDSEILAKRGYKGWTLEKAALDAEARGIPGMVVYCFLWTAELSGIIAAYNEQEEAIKEAEKTPPANGYGNPSGTIDIEFDVLAKLSCQLLKNRKTLRTAWKAPVPLVHLGGALRTENRDGVVVTLGNFKCISLEASRMMREHL